MFTGLVSAVGEVRSIAVVEGGRDLTIAAPYRGLVPGESVAVSGACLTVTKKGRGWFAVHAVRPTLERTRLGDLRPGEKVNLERALRAGEPLGGHLVQGHVDGLGRVLELRPEPDGTIMVVGVEEALARYLVVKGSVAVDGVSLTVAGVGPERFWVALIPHTLAVTTLGARGPGAEVQLEVDVMAKYVERLAAPYREGVTP